MVVSVSAASVSGGGQQSKPKEKQRYDNNDDAQEEQEKVKVEKEVVEEDIVQRVFSRSIKFSVTIRKRGNGLTESERDIDRGRR